MTRVHLSYLKLLPILGRIVFNTSSIDSSPATYRSINSKTTLLTVEPDSCASAIAFLTAAWRRYISIGSISFTRQTPIKSYRHAALNPLGSLHYLHQFRTRRHTLGESLLDGRDQNALGAILARSCSTERSCGNLALAHLRILHVIYDSYAAWSHENCNFPQFTLQS
jgi:hypothetical protein